MKKRLCTLLLALTVLLSALPMTVWATDSCVAVKEGAVTTGEVVAGSLLEIKLGDIFRDTDGHALTYTLTNAAQFSVQTKVKDGSLYVSEKDPGTYEPKVKATCSDGKELTATFTITVKEAPHGLDAQYNYDETPAKEVTVYVTISNDGVPIRGRDGTVLCHKAITVPYFDLGRYNLSEYYRYHTENGEGKYIDENIVERPTGLHLYLYLLERYFIGLPEEQCCKGAYPRDALASFKLGEDVSYMDETPAYTADSFAALTITGSPTSLYMANFWGHDENLMYYRNHCFPYMSPGWGSTSDYIVLSDGDTWDVAMFTNWSFYSSGGAFTCFDKDAYNARPGMELTVNTQAYGTTFEGSDFYPFSNLDVFLSDNGIFRKRNRDGTIWSLSLSAAVFYLTPAASEGYRSTLKPSAFRDKSPAANLSAQIIHQEKPLSEKAALNPDWVEWLMGFPQGWTAASSGGRNPQTSPA